MLKLDPRETNLFQMTLFEKDAFEIVMFDNTQKLIDIGFSKSMV